MPVQFTCPQCNKTTLMPACRAAKKNTCSRRCASLMASRPAIKAIGPSVAYIPLVPDGFSRIHWDDADFLSLFKWHAHKSKTNVYACSHVSVGNGKYAHLAMHRCVAGDGAHSIDHRDRDGLNNERRNLRPANHYGNMQNVGKRKSNTSGVAGVCLRRKTGRWLAAITANGQRYFLGSFASLEEASAARNEAALRLHREFARND